MNGYMDHNIIQFECEEYVGILLGILSVPQNKHVYHNNVMHGSYLLNTMVKHGGLNHVFKSNVFVHVDRLFKFIVGQIGGIQDCEYNLCQDLWHYHEYFTGKGKIHSKLLDITRVATKVHVLFRSCECCANMDV